MDQEDKVLHRLYQMIGQYLNSKYGAEPTFTTAEQKQATLAEELPSFDPEDLMRHDWKGRRTGEGRWAKGKLDWGWDFVNTQDGKLNFKQSTVDLLKKGPQLIDKYQFKLSEDGRFINVEKVTQK